MGAGDHFLSALNGAAIADVEPLARVLEVPLSSGSSNDTALAPDDAQALWHELSYLGSHGFAYLLRGREGVEYAEIVRDVCEKRGLKRIREGNTLAAIESNEQKLIRDLFEEIWDKMSPEERRALLSAMNLNEGKFDVGGAAAAALIAAGNLGGFAAYQLAVIVANAVARALLGRGLAFGANAALAQALGVVLGPVGWIASGAWLVSDLAGPAYRKTVPAVVQVAALRQAARNRSGHGGEEQPPSPKRDQSARGGEDKPRPRPKQTRSAQSGGGRAPPRPKRRPRKRKGA